MSYFKMAVAVPWLVLMFAAVEADWSYTEQGAWGGSCTTGLRQSPINIESSRVVMLTEPNSLILSGYANITMNGQNTGRMLTFNIPKGEQAALLSGGPLKGHYRLSRIDMHWMAEHALDNNKHAVEAQFVHVASNANGTDGRNTSVEGEDSTVILVVLFELTAAKEKDLIWRDSALKKFLDLAMDFTHSNTVNGQMDLDLLIAPLINNYFLYHGSLTTPNCDETVTWVVLESTMYITDTQLRSLYSVNVSSPQNYRDLQPLNNRTIYGSMLTDMESGNVDMMSDGYIVRVHICVQEYLNVMVLTATIRLFRFVVNLDCTRTLGKLLVA